MVKQYWDIFRRHVLNAPKTMRLGMRRRLVIRPLNQRDKAYAPGHVAKGEQGPCAICNGASVNAPGQEKKQIEDIRHLAFNCFFISQIDIHSKLKNFIPFATFLTYVSSLQFRDPIPSGLWNMLS